MFKNLSKWSLSDHNQLPWRTERSLYRTLVSEIMLQQTTVSTVINHFEKFLKTYPDSKSLAASTEDEICIAWKGLGYYRRARNLRKAAIDIETEFHGEIPLDFEKLIQISGIGEYTANAILAIGANENALAIDANIERVVSRIYGIEEKKGPKLQKHLKGLFQEKKILKEMKKIGPRVLNEAFMDLGRVYCQARKAECLMCPMSGKCEAQKLGKQLTIPFIEEKTKIIYYELDLLRIVVKKGKKALAYKKSEVEWLSGQFEIPTFVISSDDPNLKQYPKLKKKVSLSFDKLKTFKTSITKYKIKNYILEIEYDDLSKYGINKDDYSFELTTGNKANFSTASTKVFDRT